MTTDTGSLQDRLHDTSLSIASYGHIVNRTTERFILIWEVVQW